jgi:hypothetical protein
MAVIDPVWHFAKECTVVMRLGARAFHLTNIIIILYFQSTIFRVDGTRHYEIATPACIRRRAVMGLVSG